jgi:hypothetical protein
MAYSIDSKIDSLDDLLIAARLFEINETPETLKEVWERKPEPIKVGGGEEAVISQIIKVWHKDNATYALLNCGRLIIIDDSEYNNAVIREGVYIYKKHFLLVNIENLLPHAKYLDKVLRYRGELPRRRGFPEEPLDSLYNPVQSWETYYPLHTEETLMEALAAWGYVETPLRCPDLEENRKRLMTFNEKLGDDATLTPDACVDEDGVFEVIGKRLHEWLILPEADYHNWNYPMEDLLNYAAYRIYAGLRFYLEDGTHKIR